MGPGYEALAPDVKGYQIENGLLVKAFSYGLWFIQTQRYFRRRFSEFADARTLKNFNTVLIGRDRHQAQSGDLLIFYQPWVQKFPYHVMIFLGKASHSA